MRINKFKIFSYIGLGLATVAAVGTYAGYAEIVVNTDPRIYVASKTADIAGKGLDIGGNYLWNQELVEQNQNYLTSDTKKVKDFQSELKECECDNWEEIEYWNLEKGKVKKY